MKYQLEHLALIYYPQYDRIHLMNIIVPKANRKQGIGTKAVQEIINFAHSHGCSITLTPGVRDKYVGTTSQSRLKRFYRGLGFKKNKDYRFSASMVNKPNKITESINWQNEVIEYCIKNNLDLKVELYYVPTNQIETYEIHQSTEKINKYKQLNLPPIWVTDSYKLLDGHHRLMANMQEHKILAYVINNETYDQIKSEFEMGDIDICELLAKHNHINYP